MAQIANRRSRYFGLSAYWFATSLKWFILLFLLPTVVNEIVPGGEKNRWWGLIVAVGAIEAMIGPAIMGILSDRSSSKWGRRRPFIALGSALTAIALLWTGQAHSLLALTFAYLLIQISDDVGTGPYSSAIPELVEEADRGAASGHMGLLQLAGQIVAVAIGLGLGSKVWLIFLSMAAINVVCAIISIVAIAQLERGRELAINKPMTFSFATFWEPLRDADFRWAWFTRFLNAVGFYIVLTYLTNFLTDVIRTYQVGPISFAKPLEATIAMAAVLSLSGAVSSVINGKRADRIGRKRVVVEAGWTMFVPLMLFPFVPNYAALLPLAIVFGVGYGAYLSADWALVSDVLPDKDNPARDMGVWQISVAAPQVLSGAIGLLIDVGNRASGGAGYKLAFVFAGLATLAGSVLVKKIRGST